MISQSTLERVMKANDTLAKRIEELEAENLELQKDRDVLSFEVQDLQKRKMKCHIKAQFILSAIIDDLGNNDHSEYTIGFLSAGKHYKPYFEELEELLR